MAFYHYTCSHGVAEIRKTHDVRPIVSWAAGDRALFRRRFPVSGLGGRPAIVWLTSMSSPDRDALGLTSTILACDRTEWRIAVAPSPLIESWSEYKRRARPNAAWVFMLEHGKRPETWYVSEAALPVVEIQDVRALAEVSP